MLSCISFQVCQTGYTWCIQNVLLLNTILQCELQFIPLNQKLISQQNESTFPYFCNEGKVLSVFSFCPKFQGKRIHPGPQKNYCRTPKLEKCTQGKTVPANALEE